MIKKMPHATVNQPDQENERKKSEKASSEDQNIKLHESPNPWRPLHKCDTPLDEKDWLKRKVLGVLNKLTPQKFETLLSQLKGLNIDTEEKLTLVTDLVFEKAVYEPKFSVPYANLSKHLSLIKVPVSGTSGTQVNFRKLLLAKCQKEFFQARSNEHKNEEQMKTLEAVDPDKRKEIRLEYEEEEKKIRYRQLGNIRFIGELFKLGMLIEPIMHESIEKLLSQGDEESLECLCQLLKIIGKELDDTKATKNSRDNQMDMYFAQMKLIVDKRLTSSRVRFMLQDVIDLKKNNWVPRRDENNPKTIDQIHKEAEREAREQQQVYQNMSNYPKRISDDRDRRKNTGRMGPSEDGWTSSSKSSKGSYSVVDPSKLKLTKPDGVESIRLGPGGRGLQSWGICSSGGTKTTADADKTALTKRFSALSEQSLSSNYEGRRGSQRSAASSRESSRGRNSQLPPAIRKTPSASQVRENLLELLETFKGLTRASKTKASETEAATDVAVEESALSDPVYSEDDIQRKTNRLIDEFLRNNDIEGEALSSVPPTPSVTTTAAVPTYVSAPVFERNISPVPITDSEILNAIPLARRNPDTTPQRDISSNEISSISPSADKSLRNEIALFHRTVPKYSYKEDQWSPLNPEGKKMYHREFLLQLQTHPLSLCKPSNLPKLSVVKDKFHIQELTGGFYPFTPGAEPKTRKKKDQRAQQSSSTTNPKPRKSVEMKEHLSSLLEKDAKLEEIFDWINANVPETRDPTFIRTLVTAVHKNCCIGSGTSWKVDISKLKSRTPLISRYVSTDEKLQLHALYAAQALSNRLNHPSGLLHQMFDVLYDEGVVSDEALLEWEKNDDPYEEEKDLNIE